MVKLTLQPSILGCENEIPITTRTTVVSPMWNRGVISEYGIQGYFRFVLVPEIFRPGVNFFLSGRIPWHFATERVCLAFPSVRPLAHLTFQSISLLGHVLVPEVAQNGNEDGALHLAEDRQILCVFGHRHRGFVSLIQIPVPGMIRHQIVMIARQPVENPVSSRDVWIVVRPVDRFACLLVPTGPGFPVKAFVVVMLRQLVGLVVEQTFA